MPDISAAVGAANRTITMFVNGLVIQLIFRIVQITDAIPGEQMPMACVACGHNTVKEVYTAPYRFDNVRRRADSH